MRSNNAFTAFVSRIKQTSRPFSCGPVAAWLMVLLFVVMGVVASIRIPLYNGFDEGWHAAYVEHYALGRPVPNLNKFFQLEDPETPYWQTHEASQPPLYYMLAGKFASLVPRENLMQTLLLESLSPNQFYGALMPADDGRLGQGQVLAAHLVRFMTVLMGGGLVICTYYIAFLLTQNARLALFAAALTAFNPRNIALSAAISNDMAVGFAVAVTILLTTYYVTTPKIHKAWLIGGMGFFAGISLLTKYSGGNAIVVVASAVVVKSWVQKQKLKTMLHDLSWVGLGALLVTGWYFMRNWQLYGDILAFNKVREMNPSDQTRGLSHLISAIPYIVETCFSHPAYTLGVANSYNHFMPKLIPIAFVGTGFLLFRRKFNITYLPLFVAFIVNAITYYSWFTAHGATENIRFFAPSFVTITIFIAMGWLAFVPERWQSKFVIATSSIYFLFTSALYLQSFNEVFNRPTYLDEQASTQIKQRSTDGQITFENGLQLLDVKIDKHRLNANEPIQLTLVWQSTRVLTENVHLMFDVRDENNQTIAALNTGNAMHYSYVARAWQTNRPLRETYFLAPVLGKSGIVRVLLGVFKHATPSFEPVRTVPDSKGSVEIAKVKVFISNTQTSLLEPMMRVEGLADLIQLDVKDNEVIARWRATAQPEQNYKIFIHGLDSNGKMQTQADTAFSYPATYWHIGEEFEQHIPILNLQKAQFVLIGTYDGVTQQRLRALDKQGNPLKDNALLIKP